MSFFFFFSFGGGEAAVLCVCVCVRACFLFEGSAADVLDCFCISVRGWEFDKRVGQERLQSRLCIDLYFVASSRSSAFE